MTRRMPVGSWLAWQGIGFLFLALWPSYRWFGGAVWDIAVEQRAQIIGHAASYLLGVLLALALARRVGLRPARTLAAAAIGLEGGFVVLLLNPGQPYEPGLLVVASCLIVGFMIAPLLLGRVLPATATAVTLAGVGVVGGGMTFFGATAEPEPTATAEVYYGTPRPIRITRYADRVGTGHGDGGALVPLDEGLLLAGPSGRFLQLAWPGGGDSLSVAELPLLVPINSDAFDADVPPRVDRARFRVTGASLERTPGGDRLLVSHHYWHADPGCVTLRLSVADVPGRVEDRAAAERATWSTVHDAAPCLPLDLRPGGEPFDGHEMGGRLVRLAPGRFLWTVGNPADGLLSQDSTTDLGKTRIVDLGAGTVEPFTKGHRNPQGAHLDPEGRIWETEHGPRGGDELNLLSAGADYGWPYDTYGIEYTSLARPPYEAPPDAAEPTAPVHAWVPSIGISNLIAIRGPLFSRWRGDLLVGSLRARSLYRVRLEGSRVAYVEPIEIGERIRDLAETREGRIVLWTDSHEILSLRPLDPASDGAAPLASCFECHAAPGTAEATGPDLRGVFGRSIAALPGFDYSAALRGWDGRWTGERLHRYLADPQGVVPGTSMAVEGIRDSVLRAAIVDALTEFR